MSDFSTEWLARREPHDVRARNSTVLGEVARSFAPYRSVTVADLACGTGATMRAISGALPRRQSWRLVDNNLSLLARVACPPKADVTVRATPLDLAHDLELVLDGPLDLVTVSAFLDLVSAEWIERLVSEIAARQLPLYAALSFDGRVVIAPADRLDPTVVAAFNQHQRTDKGFGPALGPVAARTAIGFFERIGYTIVQGASDWVLGAEDDLQVDVLSELARAATEMGVATGAIEAWMARRKALLGTQSSTLRLGQTDFFAYPSGKRHGDRSQSNNISSPSG